MTPLQIAENLSAAGLDHPAVDDAVIKLTNAAGQNEVAGGVVAWRGLLERAVPFIRDEAEKYEDDGSNEPLELAREIESLLASSPSDESALSSASSAFDGGAEATHPSRGVVDAAVAITEISDLIQAEAFEYPTANTHTPRIMELCQRLKLIARHLQAAALPAVPEVCGRCKGRGVVDDNVDTDDCGGSIGTIESCPVCVDTPAATPAHDQPEGSDND